MLMFKGRELFMQQICYAILFFYTIYLAIHKHATSNIIV